MVINLAWSATSRREAERLSSEVLLADAMQTRGDVWTSLAVIARAGRRAAGHADPRSARGAGRRGFHRLRRTRSRATTTRILSDRIVIAETDLEASC